MAGNTSPHDPLAVGAGAFAPLRPHMLEPVVAAHFATASLHFGANSQTVPAKQKGRRFDTNDKYWMAAIKEELFVSQQVVLTNFALMEWYPRCPGLYHTPQAEDERENARHFVLEQTKRRIIFDPYGKGCMLNGGIGSIRLRPIDMGGSRLHMMTASSTGVCHEGVPLGLPDRLYGQLINQVRANGFACVNIAGELEFIPLDMSEIYRRYTGLPQIFLRVYDIELAKNGMGPALISPAITFSSQYEGETRSYACYVTADAADFPALEKHIHWMDEEYVSGHYQGSVLTDFDQTIAHFQNVKFSLEKVMNFGMSLKQIEDVTQQNYIFVDKMSANYVHMQAEWVKTGSVMGDMFSNISDSTIINRSKVEHSFNRAEQLADAEPARALVEVARIVQEAGREDGERLLAEFMSKLDEREPSKPLLKALWSGLVEAVPVLKGMTDISTAVGKLFA